MKAIERLEAAKADLVEIAAYLEQESPAASERFLIQAEAAFEQIASSPGIGRIREDIDPMLGRVRAWAVDGFPNHLIFYEETADAIVVLRVLHGARRVSPEPFG